ncbi:DMT family transporter [Microcoleus sp. Pol7_A1]|uniref:DMT family transporter n=1 Tax=Microcoleus sp. Pol7_A1 TaxID=2818893 RepID=UPI002FD5AF2F
MNSPDKKARELRHKEQELRKREQEIRLRELEAEIDRSVPEHLTSKYEEPDSQVNGKLKQWRRKIIAAAQFTGIVIAVIVAVRIASWLAAALIVGGIALIAYKMFIEEDRS